MAGTVTCTPLPEQGGMLIDIDWTGDAHPNANLKIERITAGQPNVVVRGAYAPTVVAASGSGPAVFTRTSCGRLLMWDFEAPFDTPVQYRATDDPAGDTVTSSACVLFMQDRPWLMDPLRPCHNIHVLTDCDRSCPDPGGVIWIGHERETYASASAQFEVVGRRRPIDVSNVRKDATTSLFFATITCDDRDKLLELTAPGTPIFIPPFPAICWPGRYLALGEHTVAPLSRDLRRQPRLHSMPAVVVDAPVGPICCTEGTTWCDMCNQAATWAAFDALALTGVDVLKGLAD
jgi:hypothetical protein